MIDEYHQRKAPIDKAQIYDKLHGRDTTWDVSVYDVENLKFAKGWHSINRFIVTQKTVICKGLRTTTMSYRISDVCNISAEGFANGIGGHWGIENKSHWVRDVNFKEDDNKIKDNNSAVIMAVINTIAVNFLKEKIDDSVKKSQIIFGQNVKELVKLFRN